MCIIYITDWPSVLCSREVTKDREKSQLVRRLDQCWNPLLHNFDNLLDLCLWLIDFFFSVTHCDKILRDQFRRKITDRICFLSNQFVHSPAFFQKKLCSKNQWLVSKDTNLYLLAVTDVKWKNVIYFILYIHNLCLFKQRREKALYSKVLRFKWLF